MTRGVDYYELSVANWLKLRSIVGTVCGGPEIPIFYYHQILSDGIKIS
jgi:hypothetical protein